MFAGLIALVVIFSSATGVADEGCIGSQTIHGVSVECNEPRQSACVAAQNDWFDSHECTNGAYCPSGCTAVLNGVGYVQYSVPGDLDRIYPVMNCGCRGPEEY